MKDKILKRIQVLLNEWDRIRATAESEDRVLNQEEIDRGQAILTEKTGLDEQLSHEDE